MGNYKDLKARQAAVIEQLNGLKTADAMEILFPIYVEILNQSKNELFGFKPFVEQKPVRRGLSRIERDPEVLAYIHKHHESYEQLELLRQMKIIFGDRCPSQSGLSRYLSRQRREGNLLDGEVW